MFQGLIIYSQSQISERLLEPSREEKAANDFLATMLSQCSHMEIGIVSGVFSDV